MPCSVWCPPSRHASVHHTARVLRLTVSARMTPVFLLSGCAANDGTAGTGRTSTPPPDAADQETASMTTHRVQLPRR